MLVNGLVHVVVAAVTRGYNPGLATAALLFLPVGGVGAYLVGASPGVGLGFHLLGLAVAVGVHLVLVGYILRHRRLLVAP